MKTFKTIGATLLLVASTANAERSLGSYDCGGWFTKKEAAIIWVSGYLSGMNVLVAEEKTNYDPLQLIKSREQVILWMDNYCQKNPLSGTREGAIALFQELQKNYK